MAKPKSFLKHPKSKKKHEQILETADDYLAAGVDHEEAAGKWRAGDAVKSMRFFTRALDVYEQGLQRFPQNLDLAYNKARLQYEVATHPILIRQLQVPLLKALEIALDSHRYALKLDPENPDSLFNTSQVLTSIAEEGMKDGALPEPDAIQLLEEALSLQDRCLAIQEIKFEESKLQAQNAADLFEDSAHTDEIPDAVEDESQNSSETSRLEQQWASVVEPVTFDTLTDTILAQLGTLTALCSALTNVPASRPGASLPWVEEYSSKLLEVKLPSYIDTSSDRLQEIALARANFMSALLEAGFRVGRIDDLTYKRERDQIFSAKELDIESSSSALIANAYSLVSFNFSLSEILTDGSESKGPLRWNALSAATQNLAKASKLTDISSDDLPRTHALRGDCALLMYHLGRAPISFHLAIESGPQLLKNAQVFYRNGAKLSQDSDEQDVCTFRALIVHAVESMDKNVMILAVASAVNGRDEQWKQSQLEDMVEEALLTSDFLSA